MAVAQSTLTLEEGIDTLKVRNPATGAPIATVPVHGRAEVDAAVARARAAAESWSALGHRERCALLLRWRRELARRADEIVDLVHAENGKPRRDALAELFIALSLLTHAATRAGKVLRPRHVSSGLLPNVRATVSYQPFGVVGVIGPWNYPVATPMGSIASALAAGNTVVFKPSELTPLAGRLLAEAAATAVPFANVLQVVTGDGRTGDALARAAVDKISFTGSTATGRKVMAAAADRLTPVVMELGGKDAMVVAADADIEKAARAAVWGALTNAGQACISIERVYVDRPAYDGFVAAAVRETERVRAGDDDEAHIGPITRPEQVGIIRDHLEDALRKGARALCGGPDGIRGAFVPPTVLVDVTPDMKVMREETFGPVLPIVPVDGVEDGLRQANASSYGLGSAIFAGRGARRLAERMRAGSTSVNSVWTFLMVPSLPFGGVGASGFGRIHGDEGLREFARVKSTAEERFALPLSLTSFHMPHGTYERLRAAVHHLFGGGLVDQAGEALRRLGL
jgi:acyl-CoA reductase-like NAD-dependent aldehyde dehydrogenase